VWWHSREINKVRINFEGYENYTTGLGLAIEHVGASKDVMEVFGLKEM
jgi:hypothetical protein